MLNVTLSLTAQDLLNDEVFEKVQILLGGKQPQVVKEVEKVVPLVSNIQEVQPVQVESTTIETELEPIVETLVLEPTATTVIDKFNNDVSTMCRRHMGTTKILQGFLAVGGEIGCVPAAALTWIVQEHGKDPGMYQHYKKLIENGQLEFTTSDETGKKYRTTKIGVEFIRTNPQVRLMEKLSTIFIHCAKEDTWNIKAPSDLKYTKLKDYMILQNGRAILTAQGKELALALLSTKQKDSNEKSSLLPTGKVLTDLKELPKVVAQHTATVKEKTFTQFLEHRMWRNTLYSKDIPEEYRKLLQEEFSAVTMLSSMIAYKRLAESDIERSIIPQNPGEFVVYRLNKGTLIIQKYDKDSTGTRAHWLMREPTTSAIACTE